MSKLFLLFTIILITSSVTINNILPVTKSGNSEISISPQSKNTKKKLKKPLNPRKAQKIQARNEKKQQRDYEKYIKNNRKRSLEIQTPEVRERMQQNVKNSNSKYKAKKKTNTSRSKKARKKYK